MRRRVPWPLPATLAGAAFALLLVACRPAAEAPQSPPQPGPRPPQAQPRWAVSPARPGPDRPPTGRSLFDLVASREQDGRRVQDIPFPFEALLRRIDERAGCDAASPCTRAVLIPLGRSLQRLTASPAFFAHPRVVVAVDAEGVRATRAHALLKDRLYLGYQEQAGLIEVISYNESAGRFEFQLVHDYRAGATPRIRYARRELCAACHQNLAPIFSRPLWAETNANPRIAAALQRHGDAYHGVPVRRGVDIPAAIDASTDRANLFGVWQRLWRDGCGDDDEAARRCRGAALLAALQYRLGGERGFDENAAGWRTDFLPVFAREWQARWPAGLAIPNPDLPGRDPLPPATAALPTGAVLAAVAARFEPLQPRPPLEVWSPTPSPDPQTPAEPVADVARRYIAGLAGLLSNADIIAIDQPLRQRASAAQTTRRRYTAPCTLERSADALRFRCDEGPPGEGMQLQGRLVLRDGRIDGGIVDGLDVAGHPPSPRLTVTPGTALAADGTVLRVHEHDRPARLADGAAIDAITLRWSGDADAAEASIDIADDLAPLRNAIASLAVDAGPTPPLSSQPFGRTRVMTALLTELDATPLDSGHALRLPPAQVEAAAPSPPTQGPARRFAEFYTQCASCHATAERTPPNFLTGSGEQVAAKLRHCAPRLYVRLALWRREPALREKTPMPPPLARPYPHDAAAPKQIQALEQVAAGLLRTETGRPPQLDALLLNDYEALRPCLPEAG